MVSTGKPPCCFDIPDVILYAKQQQLLSSSLVIITVRIITVVQVKCCFSVFYYYYYYEEVAPPPTFQLELTSLLGLHLARSLHPATAAACACVPRRGASFSSMTQDISSLISIIWLYAPNISPFIGPLQIS